MNRKILFLPLLLMAVAMMAESKLTVIDLNGIEEQYALSQIGKITFENEVMYLYDFSGTLLGSTSVANVAKVVVEDVQSEQIESQQFNGRLLVYPNPTQDALIIKGLDAGQTVRVYDLQGKQMLAVPMQTDGTLIQVNGLQNGTYLLQAGAQVVKFIKE